MTRRELQLVELVQRYGDDGAIDDLVEQRRVKMDEIRELGTELIAKELELDELETELNRVVSIYANSAMRNRKEKLQSG